MRVGVFDSGIGGVNVLSCLRKKYPNNDYIYFGDTLNLPYGDKTKEKLFILASAAIDFLLTKNVDIIIIACGTVSSNCYSMLKNKYSIPLYDIISPTIEYLKNCDYKNIGVIGTNRTIESKMFDIYDKNVITLATPNFVPIIENNMIDEFEDEIKYELSIFKGCDVLVLGCTHYPSLKRIIDKIPINTLDMGEVLTEKLDIENVGNGICELYFSLISDNLVDNINQVLGVNYKIYQK